MCAAPAPPRSSPSTWRYRPELDGLRSFAVVVIVFFHARVAGAASSFIVLDLFFVLSGFLVSNVVLSEMDATGELRLGRYFARRVRRLLPAAVVTIVVTSVVFVLVASEPERAELVRHAQAALVYLANWQFLADGADYFAGDIRESPFMHFWSLSIEEQFYIGYPLLLLAWWRFARGRGRVLLAVLAGLLAASVVSQLVSAAVDPTRAYFATDARLFQLLAGAGAAVALRELATSAPGGGVAWPRWGTALAWAGAGGYLVFGTELLDLSVSHRNLVATVVATSLVLGVYTAPGSWVARVLALPWMTYLGRISYGIYLWHWPILLVLGRLFEVRPLVLATMALVLAVAMASMSYELLETPVRRAPRLDRFAWPVVGAGLTASLLVAATVVGPILTSSRTPVAGRAEAGAAGLVVTDPGRSQDEKVPGGLDFQRLAKDRGPVDRWCTPSEPGRCTLVEGDGPHVLLVGDSHARMLAAGLREVAEAEGLRLSLSVVASCPWQDGLVNGATAPEMQERCVEARRDFYDRTLPRLDPDVVVLSQLARSDEEVWQGDIVDYDGRRVRDLNRAQLEATTRTVDKIRATGAGTIVVKSIMGTEGWELEGFDPLDCLARAARQSECLVAPPLDRPVADGMYEAATISRDGAASVDLNPVFCPDAPTCRPVLDGVVVWRDEAHLSGSITRHLRDRLWNALTRTGLVPAR